MSFRAGVTLTTGVLALLAPGLPALASPQERIIGLVEVPALHESVNSGLEDAPRGIVTLRAEPDPESAAVVSIRDRRELDSREHSYEQVSAVVYATAPGSQGELWYKVRYTVAEKTGFGWLSPHEAGPYREASSLIVEGMSYLTEDWDRRLFQKPDAASRETKFDGPERQPSVRILEVYHPPATQDPWYLLAIVRGACTGEPVEILAAGWVPAYTPAGLNATWFYSRGC